MLVGVGVTGPPSLNANPACSTLFLEGVGVFKILHPDRPLLGL